MKVYIDAGHGTPSDVGAVLGLRYESNDALILAFSLDKKFKDQGWNTILSRTNGSGKKLADRIKEANTTKCDIYLSLHRNAAVASGANGIEIWLNSKAPTTYKTWAINMLSDWTKLGFVNRGVKLGYRDATTSDFAVNRDTTMPSMLIELGFITNVNDNKLLDINADKICDSIVRRCCEFKGTIYKNIGDLSTDLKPVTDTPPVASVPNNAKKYKVQSQIYWSNKAYADAYANKLNALSVDGVKFTVTEV